MNRVLKIGLAGAGMFGGEVHLRTYMQLQRSGLAPWLGRIGLDAAAPELRDVRIVFVALATHTAASGEKWLREYTGQAPAFSLYHGDTPWTALLDGHPDLDVLAVATPDHLHTEPILAALERGVHVITEKPMTLSTREADDIIAAAHAANRIVGVDMHKRYDPDHLRIRDELLRHAGTPLYGTALLEEPLLISTVTFKKWAHESDPFSYVGCHWTDLIISWFGATPVSLHAVGQKALLLNTYGIDAFDAVQVKVQFDNGMSIDFINNWILPEGFEGPVNQESRIVGTLGIVESDTQYRGLRYSTHRGTYTRNTHFVREVARPDGSQALVGYGVDSLIACLAKIAEVKFLGKSAAELMGTYPDATEARLSVLIVEAARAVCKRNFDYTQHGRGAPVTALFDESGITLCDPHAGNTLLYDRAVKGNRNATARPT